MKKIFLLISLFTIIYASKAQLYINEILTFNTDTLSGANNLFANPQFADILQFNFKLLATSPCIDAGDPTTPPDSDGTTGDIGAKYVFQSNLLDTAIVINEINYLSYPLEDAGDWFEIYNITPYDVDLFGKTIMQIKPDNYNTEINLDIKGLQQGIYIVRIGENSSKFVKL